MTQKDIRTKNYNNYRPKDKEIYDIRESTEYASMEIPVRPSETTKNNNSESDNK